MIVLNDDIKNNLMVNNSLKEKRDTWIVHADKTLSFRKTEQMKERKEEKETRNEGKKRKS